MIHVHTAESIHVYSEVIRNAVIGEAEKVIAHHPALAAAREGKISPVGVSRYLASIHYMLQHTVPHMERAMHCAQAKGLSVLSSYFREKMEEERGHDRWAAADIRRYGLDYADAAHAAPVPAALDLIARVQEIIEDRKSVV